MSKSNSRQSPHTHLLLLFWVFDAVGVLSWLKACLSSGYYRLYLPPLYVKWLTFLVKITIILDGHDTAGLKDYILNKLDRRNVLNHFFVFDTFINQPDRHEAASEAPEKYILFQTFLHMWFLPCFIIHAHCVNLASHFFLLTVKSSSAHKMLLHWMYKTRANQSVVTFSL